MPEGRRGGARGGAWDSREGGAHDETTVEHRVVGPGSLRALLGATALSAAVLLAGPTAAQTPPTWEVEIEGGPVWQTTNDVRIPNDASATRFSLRQLVGAGPWAAGRLYVTWNVSERHGLRALAAPLTVSGTGTPDRSISFAGEDYEAGVPVDATYTFDSYRLTYRYRWHRGGSTTAWIGFTAKIRDAVTALEQRGRSSRKTDVGFVPLLHLAGDWRPAPRWTASLDADALAGGPGRAVDAALAIGYDATDDWTIQAGYRTVEGGADVDSVYAFAWLHYATMSVVWRP